MQLNIFLWFVGVWIVFGLAGMYFFCVNKNVELKKRLLPVFAIVAGLGFLVFGLFFLGAFANPKIIVVMVMATTLIVTINIKMSKVCDACGRILYNHTWFSKMKYCSKCGAKLQ